MNSRKFYMDVLSILSCVAVVYLHCSTVVFVNQGDLLWLLSIVVQSIFCFAVPIFFMISGANLIGYRSKYDTKTFLIKRIRRILVPLAGFSLLYYVLACFAPGPFGLTARQFSLVEFSHDLLTNRICDVYWFLYSILGLYFVTPLLSLAANRKKLIEYLLLLSLLSTAVIPLLNRFSADHTLMSLFVIPYLTGPIFFYLLGYYVERYVDTLTMHRPTLCLIGLMSIVFMSAMTFKTNVAHTVISGAFTSYDSFYVNVYHIPCIALSLSVFLLFKTLEPRFQNASFSRGDVFRLISTASFYVYMLHMLVIHALDVYVPHRILWDLGLRPIVVVFLSFILAIGVVLLKRSVRRLSKVCDSEQFK